MASFEDGDSAREFWNQASQLNLQKTGTYAQNAKEKERRRQARGVMKTLKFYLSCGQGKSAEDYKMQRRVQNEMHK